MIATATMRALPALLALAALSACHPPQGPGTTPPPELTLHGVTLHTFRGSQQIGIGRADQLTYERTSGDSVATFARLMFIPAGTRATGERFRLAADRIEGNPLERVADADGHVVLQGQNGLVGTTAHAHFDGARSLAEGNAPVKLTGPNYGAEADGFTALLDQDDFTLAGDVKSWFGGRR